MNAERPETADHRVGHHPCCSMWGVPADECNSCRMLRANDATETAEQPICITCGKVSGTCRWTDDAERCMRVQLDKMRATLKGYEQWEANLIFDRGAWRGIDGLPHITQSLWDRLLELQAMRNTALGGVTNAE